MAETGETGGRRCGTFTIRVWAIFSWVAMFVKCVADLAPEAVEPMQKQDISVPQWIAYAAIALGIWLFEGVGAFQRSFSPMVVRRGQELSVDSPWYESLLGPFFSAGLFAATPKRLIKSWLLMFILIPVLAVTVPYMPYPWRSAVDMGVVLGLGWGTLVIAILGIRGLSTNKWPDRSPELPTLREAALLSKDSEANAPGA